MRPAFLVLLMACGCSTASLRAYRQQAAFEREYSTDGPSSPLAGGGRVLWQAWLAEGDRPAALETVESYLAPLRVEYPGAPWSKLEVLVHPARPFMAPFRRLLTGGCRYGTLVVVAWARDPDGAPRGEDPLPALPHESLHWIAASLGEDSRDGSAWMLDPGNLALDRAARAGSLSCPLSSESREAGRSYIYHPWTE